MPGTMEVVRDAGRARAALSPLRARILDALSEPDSASGVARRLGLARQKVNYHLRQLEDHGLVALVEERPRRGTVERIVRRTSDQLVLDPELLQARRPATAEVWSGHALVAAATDAVRAVGALLEGAGSAAVPTATAVADVTFADPAAVERFVEEFAVLCARHDRPRARRGRRLRVSLLAHPTHPEETA